jgi:hypothetical protein
MRSLFLTLTLRSDVVLTRTSATIGAARSLEHIPGAVLLGATAARLYASLPAGDAWTVFHSGKVRFGDAAPLSPDGQPTLPMPLSLHYPKMAGPATDGRLSDAVLDASTGPLPDGPQWKQLRDGFLDASRQRVQLTHHGSMRTALQDGRAREGFLYTLDALARGSSFLSRIDLDDSVPRELDAMLEEALTSRDIRVGRSRQTEFGRVRVRTASSPLQQQLTTLHACQQDGSRVRLLLLSDLALRDPHTGAPTLTPTAEALGLAAGSLTWDPASSYLRTRRYSPFNGKRRRPDLERQVLVAGSVITVDLHGTSAAALAEHLSAGIGDYRQDGLGRILVEPKLLTAALTEAAQVTPAAPPALPPGPLATWLQSEDEARRKDNMALAESRRWVQELERWRPRLSPAQWGQVRRIAARTPQRAALVTALKTHTTTGVGKLKRAWGATRSGITRGEKLLSLLEDSTLPDPWLSQAVMTLAADIDRGSK